MNFFSISTIGPKKGFAKRIIVMLIIVMLTEAAFYPMGLKKLVRQVGFAQKTF